MKLRGAGARAGALKWAAGLLGLALICLVAPRLYRFRDRPDLQLMEAEAALRRAISAEADRYSPASLNVAREAMDRARSELLREEARFFLLRDFRRSHELLGQAIQLARGAEYETGASKDAVRREAELLVAKAQMILDEMTNCLTESAVPLGWTTPQEAARRLLAISSAVEGAAWSLEREDYLGARTRAQRALELANQGCRPALHILGQSWVVQLNLRRVRGPPVALSPRPSD